MGLFTDYAFTSVWTISAPRETTWSFLESPDQGWTDWWPGLRSVRLDRAEGLLGSTASCRWRSPWGYRVAIDLDVVGLTLARSVDLVARGDLVGDGRILFTDAAGGATRITTHWQVTTTPRWMRVLAPMLRPGFAVGHHVVMRRGERGLDRAMRAATEVADRP